MTAKRFSIVAASILTLTAVSMASVASPASAKPKHTAASKAPTYQNDNSAVDQLFRKPAHIEAWRNAFPS